MGYATNQELKASIPRDVSISRLARQMGVDRTILAARLNSDDSPSAELVRQVRDAIEIIQSGAPTQ